MLFFGFINLFENACFVFNTELFGNSLCKQGTLVISPVFGAFCSHGNFGYIIKIYAAESFSDRFCRFRAVRSIIIGAFSEFEGMNPRSDNARKIKRGGKAFKIHFGFFARAVLFFSAAFRANFSFDSRQRIHTFFAGKRTRCYRNTAIGASVGKKSRNERSKYIFQFSSPSIIKLFNAEYRFALLLLATILSTVFFVPTRIISFFALVTAV